MYPLNFLREIFCNTFVRVGKAQINNAKTTCVISPWIKQLTIKLFFYVGAIVQKKDQSVMKNI